MELDGVYAINGAVQDLGSFIGHTYTPCDIFKHNPNKIICEGSMMKW